MKKQLLKTQEAADYIGVHKNTLLNWIKSGRKIPFSQDPVSGHRYFEVKDLDTFIKSMRVND